MVSKVFHNEWVYCGHFLPSETTSMYDDLFIFCFPTLFLNWCQEFFFLFCGGAFYQNMVVAKQKEIEKIVMAGGKFEQFVKFRVTMQLEINWP